jgi:hypothetical protein
LLTFTSIEIIRLTIIEREREREGERESEREREREGEIERERLVPLLSFHKKRVRVKG